MMRGQPPATSKFRRARGGPGRSGGAYVQKTDRAENAALSLEPRVRYVRPLLVILSGLTLLNGPSGGTAQTSIRRFRLIEIQFLDTTPKPAPPKPAPPQRKLTREAGQIRVSHVLIPRSACKQKRRQKLFWRPSCSGETAQPFSSTPIVSRACRSSSPVGGPLRETGEPVPP
jgi:hypothetical protein